MSKVMREDVIRLNFNMKKSFVNQLDEYADSMGISRPAVINFIVGQWIESRKALDSVDKLASYANTVMSSKKSDD